MQITSLRTLMTFDFILTQDCQTLSSHRPINKCYKSVLNILIIADSYIQMGNSHHPQTATSLSSEPGQLKAKTENNHLGEIECSMNPKYPWCYSKKYHFVDQMMAGQKQRRFNARIKKFADSPYIVNVVGVELITINEMCSNNNDLTVYFEAHEQTLGQLVSARIKEKKVFTQAEICEFVNKVLEALIYLQDNGFKNCHLDTQSILICKNNKLKILDMGLACNSPYQTFLQKSMPVTGFYLPPELLKDLTERNYEPYMSPKSDIFCLGMLILELACMQKLDSYYNYQKATIDYQSLIHRVSKIVYSVQLKTLIAGMLQYQPQIRLGLITSQQRVRKILGINQNEQNSASKASCLTKRARSSSTKMLKQMLVNSRKTIAASQGNYDNKSLSKKPSNASLTSMASMNSRYSLSNANNSKSRVVEEKKLVIHSRKQSELYPTKDQTTALRDLVKSKLQSRLAQNSKQVYQNKENKQNMLKECNKQNNYYTNNEQKINFKVLGLQQRQNFNNFNVGTTFLASYEHNYDRRFDSTTPKLNDSLSCLKSLNKEQSIFRMIEQDDKWNESHNSSNFSISKQNCNTNNSNSHHNKSSNVPEFSPVMPPTIPEVPYTTSIKKDILVDAQDVIRQVTEFDDQLQATQQITAKQLKIEKERERQMEREKQRSARYLSIDINNESPQHSVSLRVKKSLDKMYKTTQSITSSEQKQQNKLTSKVISMNGKNLYKKIVFPNQYWYEGEVKTQQGITGKQLMDGNGILYSSDGQIIYSGSWADGLFEGFGTAYNLEISKERVNMRNFSQCGSSWIKYEGEFSKGERQGFGTFYFVNGQKFSGCMRNGQINGYGCFYNSSNEMTSGMWVNNRLQV